MAPPPTTPSAPAPPADPADRAARAAEARAAVLSVLSRPEAPRHGLEARLRLLEDKAAIRDVVMRYGFLADAHAWHDVEDLYTDDVERVLSGTMDQVVSGKEALGRLLHDPAFPSAAATGEQVVLRPMVVADPEHWHARHLNATTVVRVSDDGLRAWLVTQYALVITHDEGEVFERAQHEGTFVFELRSTPEGWKVRRKRVISDTMHNPLLRRRAALPVGDAAAVDRP